MREPAGGDPRLVPSCTARIAAMSGLWDGFRVVAPHVEFDDTLTLPGFDRAQRLIRSRPASLSRRRRATRFIALRKTRASAVKTR